MPKQRKMTTKEAWRLVNLAAHELENQTLDKRASRETIILIVMAARMRAWLEETLGPQPGFSRRKTVPKEARRA